MPNQIASWPRPHFTPGGGDALLFYTIFGNFDLSRQLSRSKYRTSGMPDWLELVSYDREKQPEAFEEYQSGRSWEIVKRDLPLGAEQAEQQPQCFVLRAEVTDPATLDYFRDTIGIIAWLLDAGGVAVHDPQMLWLWSADEWRQEAFSTGEPHPDRHTTIIVSPEETDTFWYRTRGMRKYGRPDLSIRGVGPTRIDTVASLIERFVDYQALGGVIPDGEEVRMQSLPPGGVCHRAGNHDDPDFNNVHISVEWPVGAGVKYCISS